MKENNFNKFILFILKIFLLTSVTFIFGLVWLTEFNESLAFSPMFKYGTIIIIVMYFLMFLIFVSLYEGLNIGDVQVTELILAQAISGFITNFFFYFQVSLLSKQIINPLWFLLIFLLQVMLFVLWSLVINKIYFKLFIPKELVVIYGDFKEESFALVKKMKKRPDKYKIKKVINVDKCIDHLAAVIGDCGAVVINDVKANERNIILKYCYTENKSVYLTPKLSDIIIGSSRRFHLFDTPLLYSENSGLNFEEKFMKRFMDIIISILLLVITLPIFLIVAIAIKINDGGAILYTQDRLTINNKIFKIIKFRSMKNNAENNGAVLATFNDERVTKVGAFLRTFRLDELPQLINVLIGDMSIVGPRPERPEISAEYCEKIPEFAHRTKVKAGLTGYAQIMGNYDTIPYDKLKLDFLYIENYSTFEDIKIIFKTVKTIFIKEKSAGVK